MVKAQSKKKTDFTEGPLFWRLILFALPVMATSALQMLYNAADKVVVSLFSPDRNAVGAIGCTAYISSMVINFMIGIGTGAGVLVAQYIGARRHRETERSVHTAFCLSGILGVVFTGIGMLVTTPLLDLLDTQEAFMPQATLYLRIIFIGTLATAIYNTAISVMRAAGDSKTPFIIGSLSGLINVGLNLLFVLGFEMSAEGVAAATVISQYFSATAGVIVLMRRRGESYRFSFKKLKMDRGMVLRVLRLGVPTGIQSCCFSLTNMMSTWAINSFGVEHYVTAHSLSGNIDSFLDAVSGAFCASATTATGQNYGAGKHKRVVRVFLYSLLQAAACCLIVATPLYLLRENILSLFLPAGEAMRDEIIAAAVAWTGVMLPTYFLQGVMNATFGTVRGMGLSVSTMIFNIVGTCGSRALWIYVFFQMEPLHTFEGLALLYPFSWTAATLLLAGLAIFAFARLKRQVMRGEFGMASKTDAEREALGGRDVKGVPGPLPTAALGEGATPTLGSDDEKEGMAEGSVVYVVNDIVEEESTRA